MLDGAVKLVGGVRLDQADFGRKGDLVVRIKGQRDRGDDALIAHLEQRIDHRIVIIEGTDFFQCFGVHHEIIIVEQGDG